MHGGDLDRAEALFRRALQITTDPEGRGARTTAKEGLREVSGLRPL